MDKSAFSDAIHRRGAPLTSCIGFIDGTVRQITRPTRNQRHVYSGHKRVHCLKFQVIGSASAIKYTSVLICSYLFCSLFPLLMVLFTICLDQ